VAVSVDLNVQPGTVVVSGYSDYLIEVDGDISEQFQVVDIGDGEEGGFVAFSNGVILRVEFGAPWRISPVAGCTPETVVIEHTQDKNGSDIARLPSAGIEWVVVGAEWKRR
jgi:hypothetical protein